MYGDTPRIWPIDVGVGQFMGWFGGRGWIGVRGQKDPISGQSTVILHFMKNMIVWLMLTIYTPVNYMALSIIFM